MDLNALAGAHPLVGTLLLPLYMVANRVWGGDPIQIGGRTIGSHTAAVLIVVLFGAPIGWISAGLAGALVPLLFLAWRATVIAKDWATPDTPKEIALAFVRHLIPAGLVAACIGIWSANGYMPPFERSAVLFLALHATLATALAVRYAHTEARLAAELAAGRISQADCDTEMADANAWVELLQGLTFAAAAFAWTLAR